MNHCKSLHIILQTCLSPREGYLSHHVTTAPHEPLAGSPWCSRARRGAATRPCQHREGAGEQHQLCHVPQAAARRSGHAALPARAGALSHAGSAPQPLGPQNRCQHMIGSASPGAPGTRSTLWGWNLENLGLVPSSATHFYFVPVGKRLNLAALWFAFYKLE